MSYIIYRWDIKNCLSYRVFYSGVGEIDRTNYMKISVNLNCGNIVMAWFCLCHFDFFKQGKFMGIAHCRYRRNDLYCHDQGSIMAVISHSLLDIF
jgi:hypothetical protein